jgi:hypothetical protein
MYLRKQKRNIYFSISHNNSEINKDENDNWAVAKIDQQEFASFYGYQSVDFEQCFYDLPADNGYLYCAQNVVTLSFGESKAAFWNMVNSTLLNRAIHFSWRLI